MRVSSLYRAPLYRLVGRRFCESHVAEGMARLCHPCIVFHWIGWWVGGYVKDTSLKAWLACVLDG